MTHRDEQDHSSPTDSDGGATGRPLTSRGGYGAPTPDRIEPLAAEETPGDQHALPSNAADVPLRAPRKAGVTAANTAVSDHETADTARKAAVKLADLQRRLAGDRDQGNEPAARVRALDEARRNLMQSEKLGRQLAASDSVRKQLQATELLRNQLGPAGTIRRQLEASEQLRKQLEGTSTLRKQIESSELLRSQLASIQDPFASMRTWLPDAMRAAKVSPPHPAKELVAQLQSMKPPPAFAELTKNLASIQQAYADTMLTGAFKNVAHIYLTRAGSGGTGASVFAGMSTTMADALTGC